MNMKKRLLSALTLVALVVQLLGCLPAAAATTSEAPKIPKFLILGNSFARDAMDEFHNVLKAEGVEEYTIGYLFHEACTLAMHAEYAKSGEKQYSYRKITQDYTKWDKPGAGETDPVKKYPNTMLEALQDEDWDYVFLQGATIDVAEPETYSNGNLDFLMEYVKQNVSNPDVKLGWHMTWAFAGTFYEQRPTWGKYFDEKFQRNPQRMFKGITEAVQAEVLSRPFSIVIPSGTAVENVRASHKGDILQRDDGYHLNTFGKTVAAYCWYSALTGKPVESVKYIPSSLPTGLTVSEKDKAMIVEAVNSAVANPYSITVPTLDDSTVLYSKTAAQLFSENGKQAIVDHWCPNTRNVGTGRRDIVKADWNNVWGPKESEATVQLLRIATEPYNSSDKVITDETTLESTFAYGLYPDETLSLTLKLEDEDESVLPLDTNEYGEIELAFQYVRRDLSGVSIDLVESGFQVFVSTDGGEKWSQNYAGMKSHRIVGEGELTTGTVKQSKCYEVTSTDLTELVAEGDTNPINAIQIRPYGDFDDHTEGYTWIRGISITGYEGTAPAEEKVMVDVEEDSLRQIVAAHAKRLNSDQWIPPQDIKAVSGSAYDDETGTRVNKTRTYKAGRTYYGPVYAKKNAATYERFRADIDENGSYIGATGDEYGDDGINGMDCITVVYDCLSQITTSRSASNWYYTFYDLYDETENPNGKVIPLYQAAERGSIDRNSSNAYFASLVSAEGGQEAMYALYDELKPGDFLLNEDHIRVITSETANQTVYVGETAGTIEHHFKTSDGSELTTTLTEDNEKWDSYDGIPNNAVETFLNTNYPGSTYLWGSSMRYDRALKYTTGATKSIYDAKYLPYTMAEYAAGQVEKENVLITTNSGDFITEGFCAAIDSNYIIRTLTVTLTDKNTEESLWTDTVYGVQSDFSYLFSGERENASGVTLNAALADLEGEIGQYELKVEVLSGPRIYLADGSVISAVDDASNTVNPTTTFTYNLSSQHTQTVGEVENGTVMLNKTSAQYGDTVIVTVVPDPGYELETIYVDEEPIDGNTFTVSGDHVVTATFVEATYTVTVTEVQNGTVTVDTTEGHYGDIVTVTAVPDAHYQLKQILLNGYEMEGTTFAIARNQFVTAVFEPITYTVSVTGAQNGAVTVDKTSGIYGETVTVTVNPADGYMLSTVLVDVEAIPGTTFTITGNHTVSALFEQDTTIYTVEVVQPSNGTVAVDKTSGLRGDTVTVTATPDEGYKLWAVLVDGAAIQGNTFTIRGNHTVTALFMPETAGFGDDETLPVAIPGPQKEEPEPVEPFSLYNANMELGNSLTMYFYFKQADIDPAKDYYVTITKTYADGRADVIKTIPEEDWIATTDADVPVYRVGFDGIAAKEMADDLKVQVFTADGKQASDLLTYNIRAYAMTMLEYFTSGELATLFVDMLNYGAAAQTFFGYNTGDLANAQLTEEQQTLATQSVEPVSNRVVGDMYYNVSLQLESEILLQMYFEGVTSDMYAKVTFTDHYGTQKSAVVPFEKFHHVSGTVYYIDVEGLAVADGRQLVTCELYNGNDELVGSGTDSVESYIATMNSVAPDALYTQIMKFIDSAYRYFH